MNQDKIVTITIEDDGNLTFLATESSDVFLELGRVVTRRASHVEPAPRYDRWLFRVLRTLFPDDSRVAQWTRTWNTLWRVDTRPVGGPILTWAHVRPEIAAAAPQLAGRTYYWFDRQAAIDAEVLFLNQFFAERGTK
jgi:hypothetical protein